MRTDLLLGFGILTGPIVWFLNLEATYMLASLTCAGQGKTVLYLISALSLAATLVATGFCWSQWRRLESTPSTLVLSRKRGMALGGAGLGGLSFLVILAQAIPNVMLEGCK
ncbi:MAG TPA: hypothetical protein VK604_22950 [Bryobacteraceae bacterium]|nr:hypothetical protein [Bryobacteraceae bacterium]